MLNAEKGLAKYLNEEGSAEKYAFVPTKLG